MKENLTIVEKEIEDEKMKNMSHCNILQDYNTQVSSNVDMNMKLRTLVQDWEAKNYDLIKENLALKEKINSMKEDVRINE